MLASDCLMHWHVFDTYWHTKVISSDKTIQVLDFSVSLTYQSQPSSVILCQCACFLQKFTICPCSRWYKSYKMSYKAITTTTWREEGPIPGSIDVMSGIESTEVSTVQDLRLPVSDTTELELDHSPHPQISDFLPNTWMDWWIFRTRGISFKPAWCLMGSIGIAFVCCGGLANGSAAWCEGQRGLRLVSWGLKHRNSCSLFTHMNNQWAVTHVP